MDKLSPAGTAEEAVMLTNQPSLRDSQNVLFCFDIPAMNRWASVMRPYGTRPRSEKSTGV